MFRPTKHNELQSANCIIDNEDNDDKSNDNIECLQWHIQWSWCQ